MSAEPHAVPLLADVLTDWLREAFARACAGAAPEQLAAVGVVATANPEFGDYQCNAAMALGKVLKQPPRQLAQSVLEQAGTHPVVAQATLAGPGFINLTVRTEALVDFLQAQGRDAGLGIPPLGRGQTVVLDYSSPNVAKPMHIGHIRSTIIGSALNRLHRALGYRVVADNHIGDWGTQFGLLILGFRQFADTAAFEATPIEELERIYVKSYERAQAEPAWMDAARAELVKLQQGDAANRALWESFVAHSQREFERVYGRLGIQFDLVRGESWYNTRLAGVVERLQAEGLARESDGALCVFTDGSLPPKEDSLLKHEEGEWKPAPCIVRKSDGGFNYATTDLATVLNRVEEFNPDAIVYVTDERQQLHFRQIFNVVRRLGVTTKLVHVWFGLMRLPEGTFSTRQGNVIKLERLLDEAEQRALAIVQGSSPTMDPAQQRAVARAVGIGAVKYADLSQNPQTQITFTWDKALALDGNSGPYLQYAYARIASVRDKYTERFPGQDPETYPLQITEPIERTLAFKVTLFPDAVARAAALYRPSVVADYLYDLAQTYSSFYQNVPFLKAPDGVRESRVRLCGLVARVLKTGLELLGIETPERI